MGEKETATLDELERKGGMTPSTPASTASMPSGRVASGDLTGDGPPEAAINNTKSNIKSRADDPGGLSMTEAGEGGIAIDEEGLQRGIAVSDPGAPGTKSK